MDLDSMIDAAALLLGIGAFGGLWMAVMRFMSQRNPPAWLAMVHGFLAAAGLTLMIYAWCTGTTPQEITWSIVCLVLASLGGVTLNLRDHWRHVLLSKSLVIGHAVLAVVGYGLLLKVALSA